MALGLAWSTKISIDGQQQPVEDGTIAVFTDMIRVRGIIQPKHSLVMLTLPRVISYNIKPVIIYRPIENNS